MAVSKIDLQHIATHLSCLSDFKGKRIFISGATGFIGKWMLESLLYLNDEFTLNMSLVLLSRNPDQFKNSYPHLAIHPIVKWVKGDVRNFEFPEGDTDIIIHGATEANAKMNVEQPLEMVDVIYMGTKRILEYAEYSKAKKFLLLSSGAVYGKQPDTIEGFTENFEGAVDPLKVGAAYAEAKRLSELMSVSAGRISGMDVKIARCFAFVGPYLNLDIHYAIGNFIRNGINQEDIIIKGDGKPLRSYMYAADLLIWLWEVLHRGQANEAYNVGSDSAISIQQLAEKIAEFFPGTNVKVLNQVSADQRNQNYIPSINKSKSQLNLKCWVDLIEGIKRTIDFVNTVE